MIKISKRFATAQNQVYSLDSLGKSRLPGFYSGQSISDYVAFLGPFAASLPANHFKPLYNYQKALGDFKSERDSDIEISSLGLGSYLGDPLPEDDLRLFSAVLTALKSGINVIDTAPNYRYYKSERSIGAALKKLCDESGFRRSSAFVATKVGYIAPDPDFGLSETDVIQRALRFAKERSRFPEAAGSFSAEDVIAQTHCIHPGYIEYQLEESLANLGLETIDLLYLHNAAETRLPLLKKPRFMQEVRRAFEFLERLRLAGKIRFFGLATWNCFRAPEEEEGVYLSLQELAQLARDVGGEAHGFRFVQLPMNFVMHEAFTRQWQSVVMKDGKVRLLKILEAAQFLGVNVVTSAPLLQTYALRLQLPFEELGLKSNAQAHWQLMRSMPAEALKSVLCGVKAPPHVEELAGVAAKPLLTSDEFKKYIVSLKL